MRPVIERLVEAGADVLEVGGPGGLPIADDALPEELLPIVDVLPLQILACRLAMARGLDPDRPRGLSKITQTW
jgi:glucosamine--fructose-6-phosphate aminotransferase (isomerizing)